MATLAPHEKPGPPLPEDLHREAKAEAARLGLTLKQWVERTVREALRESANAEPARE